jgi:chitinase
VKVRRAPAKLLPPSAYRILVVLAAAIYFGPAFARLAGSAAADESAEYKIVGYYVSWAAYARRYTPRSVDPMRFTHLIYAFAKIDKAEVTLGDSAVDLENIAELQALRRRNSRLQILVAVGGWNGSADFSDVAASDLLRQRFAESAVAFLRTHNFDGIDIDWEYPVAGGKDGNTHRSADKDNFTRLLEALRNALDVAGREDGRRYLLTMASGASADTAGNLRLEAIATLVDWVGLMSYDFSGAWSKRSGHNAPLATDPNDPTPGAPLNTVSAAVARYLAAGVPDRKLLLGLPLYGRAWKGCNNRNNGEYQICDGPAKGTWEDGVLDYQDIARNYVTNLGFVRNVNYTVMAPFLFQTSSGCFISYDDEESFNYKLAFLKANRLAGAMLWEISADRESTLIGVVANELREP